MQISIITLAECVAGLLPDLNGQISLRVYGIVARFLDTIVDNLVIDDNTHVLNLTQVVNDIITALGNAAGQHLSRQNMTIQACIVNAIRNNINQSDVELVIRAIEELRRAFTVLDRSSKFFIDTSRVYNFDFHAIVCGDLLSSISVFVVPKRPLRCAATCVELWFEAASRHTTLLCLANLISSGT